MQELVELLKAEAGLTEEQAIKSIQAMKKFLNGKVPPMFSGVVNKFFADVDKAANDADDILP